MVLRTLTSVELFHLSICAFGLQFANSLQMSSASSLYKFLGAHSADLSLLWLAAPIAGLIIQPLVGQFSDSTVTPYGKRRPYLFVWGMLGALGLLLLPFATAIWFAAIMMWLISCSHNGCTEALRALISDISPNQQKPKIFALQTIFAGTGAGIAALLPIFLSRVFNFNTTNSALQEAPITLKIAFFIAGIVFIGCILWTVDKIKEKKFNKASLLKKEKEMYHKTRWQKVYQNLREIYKHIRHMPPVMQELSITQLFCWFGIFCLWLYFSLAIAQHIYGLPIHADLTNNMINAKKLEEATIWTGVCFGIYQFVSVLFAIAIPYLTQKISPKILHGLSLLIGGISIISTIFVFNPNVLIINMIGFGILWGSVMTTPYAILTSELSKTKMGVYLGIFNITITLPQIISGLTLGFITSKIFHGHAIYALALSGLSILISASFLLYQENFMGIQDKTKTFKKKIIIIYMGLAASE